MTGKQEVFLSLQILKILCKWNIKLVLNKSLKHFIALLWNKTPLFSWFVWFVLWVETITFEIWKLGFSVHELFGWEKIAYIFYVILPLLPVMNYSLETTKHWNVFSILIVSMVIFSKMLVNIFGLKILCTSVTLLMKIKMGLFFFQFIMGFKYNFQPIVEVDN